MDAAQQSLALDDNDLTTDGIKGFSKRVLRYFQDFIETDFRRQQAPRRRVILKNDAGFRMGIPLRNYSSLFEAAWKGSREPLARPFEIRIPVRDRTILSQFPQKLSSMIDPESSRENTTTVPAPADRRWVNRT
jgi:hypothetical protein